MRTLSSRRRLTAAALVSALAAASFSAYLLGRARAAGAPATAPLTYSGVLTDAAGTPLTGMRNLQVTIWDMAVAGTQQCTVGPAPQALSPGGAFQVVLPPSCTAAVRAAADLWVEVAVDGSPLGRVKLGAVPYAIEADHAVTSDQAASGFQVPGTLSAGSAQVSGNVIVNGVVIRKIARVHGLGPIDSTDNGPVTGRTLTFTKTQAATGIRISYVDDMRINSANGGCRWEIRFNGTSCATPGALIYDTYIGGAAINHHRAVGVFGTCFGLAAGNYNIQVSVGPVPVAAAPAGDCDTGWYNQYWAIEAEEVF
jgi:hypothetical protein